MSKDPPRIALVALVLAMIASSGGLWSLYSAEPPMTAWEWTAVFWGPLSMTYIALMAELAARKRAKLVAEKGLTILPSHVHTRRMTLFLFVALIVTGQAMITVTSLDIVEGDMRDVMARGLVVGGGLVMAVVGNWRAKMVTPYRGGAVEPANWGRSQRRAGWGLVIYGLVMVIGGLLAPIWLTGIVTIGLAVVVVGWAIARRVRRRSAVS